MEDQESSRTRQLLGIRYMDEGEQTFSPLDPKDSPAFLAISPSIMPRSPYEL